MKHLTALSGQDFKAFVCLNHADWSTRKLDWFIQSSP
jgi:hypothetical protein